MTVGVYKTHLAAMCNVTVLTVHDAHEVVRREGRLKFLTSLCLLELSEEMHKVVHNVWPPSTSCVESKIKSFIIKNKFFPPQFHAASRVFSKKRLEL